MFDSRDLVWSPDSRYIAFLSAGEKTFTNVHIVPITGGEARQATFLANTNARSLSWSPDGRI
jgi:Tol biopolymer transport system component